jgi:hypothetical protein
MRGLFVENISNLTQSGQLVENELVQRVVNLPDKFTAFLMNIQRPVERKK